MRTENIQCIKCGLLYQEKIFDNWPLPIRNPICYTCCKKLLNNEFIPYGDYCYDKNGICLHWKKTEQGASCLALNVESKKYQSFNLIWDQVKECGINVNNNLDT